MRRGERRVSVDGACDRQERGVWDPPSRSSTCDGEPRQCPSKPLKRLYAPFFRTVSRLGSGPWISLTSPSPITLAHDVSSTSITRCPPAHHDPRTTRPDIPHATRAHVHLSRRTPGHPAAQAYPESCQPHPPHEGQCALNNGDEEEGRRIRRMLASEWSGGVPHREEEQVYR
ncbi:hypothetical protein PYCCODRAFT_1437808 [Trametes coccinea BRFM310]|uniref:Uncharacterized protein n=1 Tax=Trametes coccinea (strain BRFM310) TaxID=1353009 RepID=A0A1Y2IHF3_TRAC3|nr:hypothetical protein PYCCODRAFT_1437808 [Trametes coccinea BRFM310]